MIASTSDGFPIERTPQRALVFVKQGVLHLRAIVQRARRPVVGRACIVNASRQLDRPRALLSFLAATLAEARHSHDAFRGRMCDLLSKHSAHASG